MFRSSERLSSPGASNSRRYLKRAGLFAGGLVLLWIALQLFPTPTAEPPVYSDEAGSVVSSPHVRSTYQGPRIFTLGNMAAFIILVGGGAFAYFINKRSVRSGDTSLIESIGELSIGQGQQLRLVRCGGEVLLIGATAQDITLLRDFDPALFDDVADEQYWGIDSERRGGKASSDLGHNASSDHGFNASSDHGFNAPSDHGLNASSDPGLSASDDHGGNAWSENGLNALSDHGDNAPSENGLNPPNRPIVSPSKRPNGKSSKRHASQASTHFSDVLRQYAGRYVNMQSNGRTC